MSVAPELEQATDLTPLVAELRAAVGDDWVYTHEHQLRTYESDGLLQYHVIPGAAVLPGSAEETQAVVLACAQAGVPWVARGAGSGLSGGALPIADGVIDGEDERQASLEIVLAEAGRLQRLIGDLLDLARLETRKFSLNVEEVDVVAYTRGPRRSLPVFGEDLNEGPESTSDRGAA